MRKTIYIMLTEEKIELDIAKIFSKVYAYVAKICISLFVTDLVSWHLIAIAYEERGYEAVGGEYIAIPIVFLAVYKFIGFVMKFYYQRWQKYGKKRSRRTAWL